MKRTTAFLSLAFLLQNIAAISFAQDLPSAANREIDFVEDVRPLFEKHCWSCHGREKQESGLRLDSRELMLQGGDLGQVIVSGNSADSRLIHYVSGSDPDNVMPPEGDRLTPVQIGILRAWIDQGCAWDESGLDTRRKSTHWAYQPLQRHVPPEVKNAAWPINAIDRFVLAELEKRGISPSPEASRYTLIRRLSLDLVGLLPGVEEVDSFVNDSRPDAYNRLVDRLMASPHFGERWGRHWLDMARYADSDGYEKDNARPDAYRWRDWVIEAINEDMPFDQFTVEQLAGDLLPDATPMQRLATAFHRQTLTNTEGGTDPEQFRVEACFDRTETTGTVWLGLTVGCARCHTHKYDAITQREYYQLFSVFNNGDEQTTVVPKSESEVAAWARDKAAWDASFEELSAKIRTAQEDRVPAFIEWQKTTKALLAESSKNPVKRHALQQPGLEPESSLPDIVLQALNAPVDQRTELQNGQLLEFFSRLESPTKELLAQRDELKKSEPAKPELPARVIVQRVNDPRRTFVLKRGEFLDPITELDVHPAGLSVLPPMTSRREATVPDRLDLARWLVSPDNPLTPRVAVNHVWRILFGHGLVRTVNDFGVRGDRPTHPELLDWLAADLVAGSDGQSSWSRKALIRRIVTSATYRQASRYRPDLVSTDPQNLLLARQNRLRVEGEIVRDISLDAAGLLSRKIGGPSVYPPLPPGIAELSYAGNFKWTESTGEDRYRRGMYTFFKRTSPHPNLVTFDCPDANLTCIERQTSNTPLQALTSLNNATFAETSRAFAKRILSLPDSDDTERLAMAFRICLARPGSASELQQLHALLNESRDWYQAHPDQATQLIGNDAAMETTTDVNAAWIATSRILLNLDEFITRE